MPRIGNCLGILALAGFLIPTPAATAATQDAGDASVRAVVDLTGLWPLADCVGGQTLFERERGWGLVSERPGDARELHVVRKSFSDPGAPAICRSEGSELRFMGKRTAAGNSVTTEPGVRLCFRRTGERWVYLSGLGSIESAPSGGQAPQSVRLGYDRTVESCLRALSSSDALIREGNARELGRLAAGAKAPEAAAKLVGLLKDESPMVRRGAAEALALLCAATAVPALKEADAGEPDPGTKAYLREALAVYGGASLLDPAANPSGDDESARLYNEGASGWADRVLGQQLKDAGASAVSRLSTALHAPAPETRAAALRLLALADSPRPAEPWIWPKGIRIRK